MRCVNWNNKMANEHTLWTCLELPAPMKMLHLFVFLAILCIDITKLISHESSQLCMCMGAGHVSACTADFVVGVDANVKMSQCVKQSKSHNGILLFVLQPHVATHDPWSKGVVHPRQPQPCQLIDSVLTLLKLCTCMFATAIACKWRSDWEPANEVLLLNVHSCCYHHLVWKNS